MPLFRRRYIRRALAKLLTTNEPFVKHVQSRPIMEPPHSPVHAAPRFVLRRRTFRVMRLPSRIFTGRKHEWSLRSRVKMPDNLAPIDALTRKGCSLRQPPKSPFLIPVPSILFRADQFRWRAAVIGPVSLVQPVGQSFSLELQPIFRKAESAWLQYCQLPPPHRGQW